MAKKKNNKKKLNKKEVEVVNTTVKDEMHKIIRLLCIVLIILGLFFLLTTYLTNKKSSKSNSKESNSSVEIGYQKVLLGNSFNVSDGEYLVLYYNMSDSDLNTKMSSLINNYESKSKPFYIYTVDMSSSFNKKHASNQANTNPTKVEELAIAGPTLIKFNNKKVEKYIEGYESIKGYLEQ